MNRREVTMTRMAGPLTAAVVAALAVSGGAAAEDVYAGKTITLYVGYSAGSNYDAATRLLARHYDRHLPGKPSIVVKNMPGSSSLKLANYLYNVAPKDGLHIGSIRNGMALEPLYDNKKVRFDPLKFNWIGSLARIHGSCVAWHTAPATTIEQAKKTEVVSGAIGTTASLAMYPRALNEMLGTKFKVVVGYTGTGTLLAMERGETQARCGGDWDALHAVRPDWFRGKDHKVWLYAMMSNQKHPDFPDAPWIFDHVKKKDDVAALRLIFASQDFGRPYVAPPGIPVANLAALRRAFDATMKDPKLKADGARMKMSLIGPMTGEEVLAAVTEHMSTPKVVIDRVKGFQKARAGEGKVERKKKKK
jgi:tripartite-type tricarboxylate transporter receptor subunit TctC